jgi:hypothetical protein
MDTGILDVDGLGNTWRKIGKPSLAAVAISR